MMKLKAGNPAGNRRRVISDLTSFRWERFLYHHVYCSSGNAILTSRRRHCELKGSLRRIDLAGHAPLPGSGQLHAGALHTARMKLRTCSVQCECSLTASRSRCLNPHVGGAGGGIRHAFLRLVHSAHFLVRSGACPVGFAVPFEPADRDRLLLSHAHASASERARTGACSPPSCAPF